MERLQIDEQLRQIGGGPRAPSGRPEKEKPFSSDNGMGHSRGGKPFGRGGRGRRGPTFASGTSTSSKIVPKAWHFKNCSFQGSQNSNLLDLGWGGKAQGSKYFCPHEEIQILWRMWNTLNPWCISFSAVSFVYWNLIDSGISMT